VALAAERGREPRVEDPVGELAVDELRADHEHVRVVVAAADLGRPDAVAERGADAGQLVARDRLARAAAADDEPEVGVAGEHLPADVLAERRVVHDLPSHVRRPVVDPVAGGLEPGGEPALELDAVVVGGDRDPHRRGS
jgi:hypothetical protein